LQVRRLVQLRPAAFDDQNLSRAIGVEIRTVFHPEFLFERYLQLSGLFTLGFYDIIVDVIEAIKGWGIRVWLTVVCFGALIISFIPGLTPLVYVSILAGSYFALTSAWDSLKNREFDVNLLMVMAAIGAVIVGHPEDAAVLLFLFSLSSTLEEFALGKTKSAIAALVKLRPQRAMRVVGDEREDVAVEDLRVGDVVQVNPFDRLPTDGEIIGGASSIDASAMTGESAPVNVQIGSEVMGGTQNQEGTLTIRVSKEVGDSALDRIVGLVADAQENKASGERISQWFGQRYTILVIVAFALSWVIRLAIGEPNSQAFYSSLILLVGMSPCALVISIPASTLSALAFAARRGILVRGGEYIEKAASVDFIALDKTGTLTKGKPRLMSAWVESAGQELCWSPGDSVEAIGSVLGKVASAESFSTHPLAVALVRAVREAGLKVEHSGEMRTIPGKGLVATVEKGEVWVGNDLLLNEQGFTISEKMNEVALGWKREGRTSVFAAGNGFLAAFSFADEIRTEAKSVLDDLKSLGVKEIVMLTGDKAETAKAVADYVGITRVEASLLPGDKVQVIQELAARGSVLMVGDGVNDAPSLAQATIGVAMGGLGSDVALEAADVVLSHDKLARIPELIRLGRRTRGIIYANLVIAGTVIAVLTFGSFIFQLPLPVAVIAHEGSTLIVILNGLRLLR
jgi:Zn2+/Cd2+-exporting ATPase